jgi:quercetin dioxygenase-like cupin family protein
MSTLSGNTAVNNTTDERFNVKPHIMKRTIFNPVIKDKATFIRTSAETKGVITELDVTLQPGGGNALHYHKTYTETFTAIEGELGLHTGRKNQTILQPGEHYTVEKMQLHRFFNPTDREIRFRIEMHPGHEGFEKALTILYGLAADGLTDKKSKPKDIRHTAILVCMSDLNAPGMLTLLFPLMKWLAKRSRRSGLEQQLINKYYA